MAAGETLCPLKSRILEAVWRLTEEAGAGGRSLWRWRDAELCVCLPVCTSARECVCKAKTEGPRAGEVRGLCGPHPCPSPFPSSCNPGPLHWRLQPCNSLALTAEITRCQQLVLWVAAAMPPPCPCASGLLVPGQGQARLPFRPVWAPGGLSRAKGHCPCPYGSRVGKAQSVWGLVGLPRRQRWVHSWGSSGAGVAEQVGGPKVGLVEAR